MRRAVTAINSAEIQLWLATVGPDERVTALESSLTPQELARASRLSVHYPRQEFVTGRATLRQILGAFLNVEPVAVGLAASTHGKPCLAGEHRPSSLQFNLSHSRGRVMIALARGREVGVDLEWMHGVDDWNLLADRVLSSRELAELRGLPLAQQREAFYNGWTRKEAWLKATGEGLMNDLSAIEVTIAPGRPPEWLGLPGGAAAMRRWTVREVPLTEGFAGAVVYENI